MLAYQADNHIVLMFFLLSLSVLSSVLSFNCFYIKLFITKMMHIMVPTKRMEKLWNVEEAFSRLGESLERNNLLLLVLVLEWKISGILTIL